MTQYEAVGTLANAGNTFDLRLTRENGTRDVTSIKLACANEYEEAIISCGGMPILKFSQTMLQKLATDEKGHAELLQPFLSVIPLSALQHQDVFVKVVKPSPATPDAKLYVCTQAPGETAQTLLIHVPFETEQTFQYSDDMLQQHPQLRDQPSNVGPFPVITGLLGIGAGSMVMTVVPAPIDRQIRS